MTDSDINAHAYKTVRNWLLGMALLIYAIDLIPIGDVRIKRLIQAVVVILAALWLAQRAVVL